MIRGFFVLGLLLACASARGQAPLTISGGQLSTDLDTGEAVIRGNPKIEDESLLLTADEFRPNTRTGTVTAIGHIVLTLLPERASPGIADTMPGVPSAVRLLADRLELDLNARSFRAENVRVGSHPFFIEGRTAAGTPSRVTVEGARGTFGEPSRWQPTFFAEQLVYEPGRQLRTEKALVGVGNVRPIPLARFEHDLSQPFPLAVELNGGFRQELGAYVEAGLQLPVSRGVRLGGQLSGYTRRGVMVGPSGRYLRPENPVDLAGHFESGYIKDQGNRGVDALGRPVSADRAYLQWQHSQRLPLDASLHAQLNWWRDSEVLRDFRPREFYPVQAPDTFAEAIRPGANSFLSVFTRLQPNTFQAVQERLPEIRFDLLPLAIGGGIYEQFSASVAVLREDPPGGGPTLHSDRLDAYYTLFRPARPTSWATITPVVGGRATHYANTAGGVRSNGSYTRLLGELGFDAEMRSSGVFEYRNDLWKIDGLRHLFTPRLSYRYIPEAEKGRAEIPRIDREVFSSYLPPLGLGRIRHIDDLHATNTVRLAFDNLLQTRDSVQGSRDLVALNLAGDYRFRRRPGERDVSDLHAELSLTPASWLQVDLYQSVSPSTFALREFNSIVTLRDADAWSVRFANNYLRREIEDYLIDGRVKINEVFEGMARLHYDARSHRMNEQSYGIVQNLGNTWLVSYMVNLYSGRRRESGFGFSLRIDTVRF